MENLENKQKLAQTLIEMSMLREQYIEENRPKRKINEADNMCTQLISSLIEEGIPYEYIQRENRKKDEICIDIDGEKFSCLNYDIKILLGDSYDTVMGESYEDITGEEFTPPGGASKTYEAPIPTAIPQIIIQQPPITTVEQKENESHGKRIEDELQKLIPPKVYLNEEDERRQTMSKKKKNPVATIIRLVISTIIIVAAIYVIINKDKINDKFINNKEVTAETTAVEDGDK